tara:strand:- start:159 stop:350 length:192 start_codon:yes stop_codon:yes gene_type:complete
MKVKVHWVIDGIAEIEAKDLEEAEVEINKKLGKIVSDNPVLEEELGAKAIQGKGYLPGAGEED